MVEKRLTEVATEGERMPLTGMRVIDASTILAGPLAAALLGDFGAEVIKVEQTFVGDPVRRYPPSVDGQAIGSKVTNRNKRSIGIDFHMQEGRALFRRLVAEADAVVVNFRPETLAKWEIDYEDLTSASDRLVMLHLTGFGRTGPYRDRPGFARIAEAYAGLTYITGFPEGPPMFAGYAVGDGLAGVYGAFSLMLALFERQISGKGQLIDLALYEPTLKILENLVISYSATGKIAERVGNLNKSVAPSDIYRTSDGKWVAIPSSTPNMYARLCEALGRRDLVEDPRFVDNSSRVENQVALDAELRPEIERRSCGDLLSLLDRAGVAAGPVNTVEDLVGDEHVWDRGSLQRVFDPNLEREFVVQGVFPKLSRTPGRIQFLGHEAGQDTVEILRSVLNCDDAEVKELLKIGAVSSATGFSERPLNV